MGVLSDCDAWHRITRVRFHREIFQVSVVTYHDEQRIRIPESFENSSQKLVKALENFDSQFHVLTVSCVVGQPILEQCEVVLFGKMPEMMSSLPRSHGFDIRVTEFRPAHASEVRRYPLISSKIVRSQKGYTGKYASERCDSKATGAGTCIVEETLGERVRKANGFATIPELAKDILRFDDGSKDCRRIRTEVPAEQSRTVDTCENRSLPRTTLW